MSFTDGDHPDYYVHAGYQSSWKFDSNFLLSFKNNELDSKIDISVKTLLFRDTLIDSESSPRDQYRDQYVEWFKSEFGFPINSPYPT